MHVEGDGVSAIFKVLQLDPGFPHHYMDVHYELVDETHGYFELAYCGALMDAEPFGDAMVTNMCHHIEDGTFDVTAQAVNPKAHIRHVHRPPRVPGDRVPHCRWEIVIEDETETLPEKDITKITRMTTAATFTFPAMKDGTPHIPPAAGTDAERVRRRRGGPPTDAPAEQPGRRHLSERQAEVMERLVAAAAEEAEERPYAEISVRTIAKRAGVAPATAYTYFSGKDHLLAEVLWRRMQSSPSLVDLTLPLPDRVADTVRTMGFGAMGSPAVAVCTTALLGDGPDVKRVRVAHRRRDRPPAGRRARARADPAVLDVLQVTYTGALLSAGMGHLAFDAVPTLMAEATALMTGPVRAARRARRDDRGATGLQPLRLRHPRGPVPDVRPAARRGARLLQRGARLLRLRRATPTCWRRSATSTTTPTPTASASTRPPSGPTRTGPCRSSPWTRPGTPACAPSSGKSFTPRRVAAMEERHPGADPGPPRPGARGGLVRLHRRLRRAAADGRDLRAGGRARRRTGPRSGAWPTCWCTARTA